MSRHVSKDGGSSDLAGASGWDGAPPLAAGEAHLWFVRHASLPRETTARFASWLTPDEHARWRRYLREETRLRFLVGRGLLRELLGRYTARRASTWEFELDAYGRPAPLDAPADTPVFNLSHSAGWSVCALTRQGPLGVDIEGPQSAAHANIAERYFTSDEVRQLVAAPAARHGECFLRFWTLKEAFVKGVGRGLSIPLDSFSFVLDQQGVEAPRLSFGPDGWYFWEGERQGARVALAWRSPESLVVRCLDWHD